MYSDQKWQQHLCLVCRRATGEVLAEYLLEAVGQSAARFLAVDKFNREVTENPELVAVRYQDWYVDSCVVD